MAHALTRRLRLVVGTVHDPVDWDDLAIAEIRVFGWPATPPPVDPRGIVCEQQGGWPLRAALSDYCAVDVATYDERLCWELLYDIARCQSTPYKRGATPIPPLTPGADGAYVLEITEHSTHRLELAPAPDGRLVVGRHTIDGRDQPIPPTRRGRREEPLGAYGQRKYTHPDFNATNTCWEKLGKERREIADEER